MITQVKTADKTAPAVAELVADTEDDVQNLSTHYHPGSTCIVIASSNVYMLNNKKEWKIL